MPSIEADAVAHRIDLQIARLELAALAKSLNLTEATRFVTLLDVAGISRRTRDPEGAPFRERGFDVQFQMPIFDGGEVRVRQAAETYNVAFNRLTERAVNVRSEARDAYRVYRSSYDIASHYQREIMPLRKIITDEMQLRFSSMQIDVFALLTEARQRLASLRGAIDAKQNFWLAQSDLQTAVNGGGAPAPAATIQPLSPRQRLPMAVTDMEANMFSRRGFLGSAALAGASRGQRPRAGRLAFRKPRTWTRW